MDNLNRGIGMKQLSFKWHCNFPHCAWGRLGGGDQWNLGLQVGGNAIIINLLFAFLRIEWKKEA